MARIRSIKPEFWTSEQVMECSPIARLLFIGMWNFADDKGRLPCAPKTLKAQILPADDVDSANVLRMIDELSANGLVQRYTIDDKEYLQITGWHHQKIDKPQRPKHPEPPEHSPNIPRKVATDLNSEGIGKDRTGKISRAPALDDDWPDDHGDQFWQAYPRKTEKLAAMKKLATIRKSGVVTFADLMAGVKRYAAAGTDPQYTKHPTTWLNAGCWADETQPGGGNGQRTGNTRTTGHDAILAVAARKARELDRNDTVAGPAGTPGFTFGDGIDVGGPGGDRGATEANSRDRHRVEPDDQRIREGEIIPPDQDAAGIPGRRQFV